MKKPNPYMFLLVTALASCTTQSSSIFLPLKLGLFGFVFPVSAKWYIFIILCYIRSYVHLSI